MRMAGNETCVIDSFKTESLLQYVVGKKQDDQETDTIVLPDCSVNMAALLDSDLTEPSEMMPEIDWDSDRSKQFKSATPLSADETRQFNELIADAVKENAFAYDVKDLGECTLLKHKIVLTDDIPVYTPPYRKSEAERVEIKKQVDEMLEAGIIRKSRSPYSSPVILVPKPNGKKRLCIDYRKLNAKTVKKRWPMPLIQCIIERLCLALFITLFDLKSGYWQFLMDEGSIKYTAFTTPDGQYEGLRMLFGLCNAPADCCEAMYDLFKGRVFPNCDFVEVYLDDLIIFSRSFAEHILHIRVVFNRLRKVNLKLNPEKCIFFAKRVRILGYVVDNGQVFVDPEKTAPLLSRPPPRNIKEVQILLGLANYYRQFIQNFASLTSPLTELLRKDTKFVMDDRRLQAFKDIICALTSEPFLAIADVKKTFTLAIRAFIILVQCFYRVQNYVCLIFLYIDFSYSVTIWS